VTLPPLFETGTFTWGGCSSLQGQYTLDFDVSTPPGLWCNGTITPGISYCAWSGVFTIPGGKGTLTIVATISFGGVDNTRRTFCLAFITPLGETPTFSGSDNYRWGTELDNSSTPNCSAINSVTLPVYTGRLGSCTNQGRLCTVLIGHPTDVTIAAVT
jgi:hypothetical protein